MKVPSSQFPHGTYKVFPHALQEQMENPEGESYWNNLSETSWLGLGWSAASKTFKRRQGKYRLLD